MGFSPCISGWQRSEIWSFELLLEHVWIRGILSHRRSEGQEIASAHARFLTQLEIVVHLIRNLFVSAHGHLLPLHRSSLLACSQSYLFVLLLRGLGLLKLDSIRNVFFVTSDFALTDSFGFVDLMTHSVRSFPFKISVLCVLEAHLIDVVVAELCTEVHDLP